MLLPFLFSLSYMLDKQRKFSKPTLILETLHQRTNKCARVYLSACMQEKMFADSVFFYNTNPNVISFPEMEGDILCMCVIL